jgi:hypothetical protein
MLVRASTAKASKECPASFAPRALMEKAAAQDAKAAASRSTWLRGKDPCSNPGRKANRADRARRRTASPICRMRRTLRRWRSEPVRWTDTTHAVVSRTAVANTSPNRIKPGKSMFLLLSPRARRFDSRLAYPAARSMPRRREGRPTTTSVDHRRGPEPPAAAGRSRYERRSSSQGSPRRSSRVTSMPHRWSGARYPARRA